MADLTAKYQKLAGEYAKVGSETDVWLNRVCFILSATKDYSASVFVAMCWFRIRVSSQYQNDMSHCPTPQMYWVI